MLREPVARQITRATLEAIAKSQMKWRSPEAVWQAFRTWSAGKGATIALSYELKPPFFHELQTLYDFGIESCPALGEEGVLRTCGQGFASILLRERLPDLMDACMSGGRDLPASLENLFRRFMDHYAGDLYRVQTRCSAGRASFTLAYAEPELTARHLAQFGIDPARSFRKGFRVIASTIEACLEYILDPWSAKNLSCDVDAGSIDIRVPAGSQFNFRKLVETLTRFAQDLQQRHQEQLLARDLEHDPILQGASMREKWEKIKLASASDELVLLRGEPGTGKTHLAERIHAMSGRKDRPFVEVCLTADLGADNLVQSHLFGHVKGAFTSAHEDKQGFFSQSNSGTIFLDEIGDASADLQAKLLRVLEKKTFKPLGSTRDVIVDVRIVAATNKDLEAMVRAGTFREDLYHRLNVIQIEMPPLRGRASEIPALCEHFIRRVATDVKRPVKPISTDATNFLIGYAWPGNIRELIHALKYVLLFSRGSSIEKRDLPEYMTKASTKRVPTPVSGDQAAPVSDAVIDYAALCRALGEADTLPRAKNDTASHPWHIDYAKKVYLRALIQHCKGNLRRITTYWDCTSERTVRTLVKRFGLWDELEQARRS